MNILLCVLPTNCMACNRLEGFPMCSLCSRLEIAETLAEGFSFPPDEDPKTVPESSEC